MIQDMWVDLTLATFAVYFVSQTLAVERGPFDLAARYRDWIQHRFGNGWVNDGVNCPICTGCYVALFAALVLVYQTHWDWTWAIWIWFALAGVNAFINNLTSVTVFLRK